mgnify:CR=1 FL=1
MSVPENNGMDQLKARLEAIVEAVGDESLPLDEALSLYEEAVSLGMRASEMVEEQTFGQPASQLAPDASKAE